MIIRVLGINGSPRAEGNTSIMIRRVFSVLEKEGIECEFIQLGGESVSGCKACLWCKRSQSGKCITETDSINECITAMRNADGIIIGSPTYFSNVTTETKALIDRAGYVTRACGGLLKRKVGAAVVPVRRSGAGITFAAINNFFLINEMIIPGSNYWNMAQGREMGDVLNDEEGMNTMDVLGSNMAFLLKKLKS